VVVVFDLIRLGTEFLFKNAVRISEADYAPTDEDKMWARTKTTGIEKVSLEYISCILSYYISCILSRVLI
jgi:hypothetical protein